VSGITEGTQNIRHAFQGFFMVFQSAESVAGRAVFEQTEEEHFRKIHRVGCHILS
jgi:hypothetical protein